jgi:hypothetical protein
MSDVYDVRCTTNSDAYKHTGVETAIPYFHFLYQLSVLSFLDQVSGSGKSGDFLTC